MLGSSVLRGAILPRIRISKKAFCHATICIDGSSHSFADVASHSAAGKRSVSDDREVAIDVNSAASPLRHPSHRRVRFQLSAHHTQSSMGRIVAHSLIRPSKACHSNHSDREIPSRSSSGFQATRDCRQDPQEQERENSLRHDRREIRLRVMHQHRVFPLQSTKTSSLSFPPLDHIPPLSKSLTRSLNDLYMGADLNLLPTNYPLQTQMRYASALLPRIDLLHKARSTKDVSH